MLSNAIRGQLAEFGIVASTGRLGFNRLLEMVDGPEELGIPKVAWVSLMALAEQHQRLQVEIGKLEQCIQAWHRSSELSRRLEEIPGVGPIVATALVGTITDPHAFASGRHMAAWIGLVPQQNSTGGKDRLGGITKQGNRYLRWLLVAGAMAVIRYVQKHVLLRSLSVVAGGNNDEEKEGKEARARCRQDLCASPLLARPSLRGLACEASCVRNDAGTFAPQEELGSRKDSKAAGERGTGAD